MPRGGIGQIWVLIFISKLNVSVGEIVFGTCLVESCFNGVLNGTSGGDLVAWHIFLSYCKRLIVFLYIVPHSDLDVTFIYLAGHVNVFVLSIISTFCVYCT